MSYFDTLVVSLTRKLLAAGKKVLFTWNSTSISISDIVLTHDVKEQMVVRDGVKETELLQLPCVRFGGGTEAGSYAHLTVYMHQLEGLKLHRQDETTWRLA